MGSSSAQQQEVDGHAAGGLSNGEQADGERAASAFTNGQHAGNGQISQV